MLHILKYYFILLVFIISNNSFCNNFDMEVYMHVTDQRTIKFPDGNQYVQLEGSANWKDSLGDYGIINCLATITTIESKESAILHAFCEAKNQKNDKFWLELNRTSDMEVGIGVATYVFGEGKYKKYKGIKCPYAVNYFEDRMFYKQKCKL